MKEVLRVLHIVSGLEQGGIEKVLENYYKYIDKSNVQFDFITHRPEGLVEKNIADLGCKIYHISFRRKHPIRSAIETYNILKKYPYSIIHIHGNIEILPELLVCRICKVKVRIAHSHICHSEAKWLTKVINKVASFFIKLLATDYFACGMLAGKWAYGENFIKYPASYIMYNAIEQEIFSYNFLWRQKMRKDNCIDGAIVIGHIGRFSEQKNQLKVLSIFKEIVNKQPNALLVFIGDGPDKDLVFNEVQKLGLGFHVLFWGIRNDIANCLQMMDILVFPSKWEGLPVVLIEAQLTGLPCVISSRITEEVIITDIVSRMDINADDVEWADKVLSTYENYNRKTPEKTKLTEMYNIKTQAKQLEIFYSSKVYT